MANRKVVALKAIITNDCRQLRGPEGAFDEAVCGAREEYKTILANWTLKGKGDVPTFNLVLELEYPS